VAYPSAPAADERLVARGMFDVTPDIDDHDGRCYGDFELAVTRPFRRVTCARGSRLSLPDHAFRTEL
jgi:hypothetical protein